LVQKCKKIEKKSNIFSPILGMILPLFLINLPYIFPFYLEKTVKFRYFIPFWQHKAGRARIKGRSLTYFSSYATSFIPILFFLRYFLYARGV